MPGNDASFIMGKVYRIAPDARAAKDGLVRIIEGGEDYLFAKTQFALVDCHHGVGAHCLLSNEPANTQLEPTARSFRKVPRLSCKR